MRDYGRTFLRGAIVERVATLPVFGPSYTGKIVYVENLKKLYYGDDVAWVEMGTGGGGEGTEDGELYLQPKASPVGTAEGTVFYCSEDNGVYVGTE